MIHVTCRLTAKNWDQLRNPTLGNRVWATSYSRILVSSLMLDPHDLVSTATRGVNPAPAIRHPYDRHMTR